MRSVVCPKPFAVSSCKSVADDPTGGVGGESAALISEVHWPLVFAGSSWQLELATRRRSSTLSVLEFPHWISTTRLDDWCMDRNAAAPESIVRRLHPSQRWYTTLTPQEILTGP